MLEYYSSSDSRIHSSPTSETSIFTIAISPSQPHPISKPIPPKLSTAVMALVLAAVLGKAIYSEAKDHREAKKQGITVDAYRSLPKTPKHRKGASTSSSTSSTTSIANPTNSIDKNSIEGAYEIAPPAYQYEPEIPIPERNPLRLEAGDSVVPWGLDSVRVPIEHSKDQSAGKVLGLA